MKKLDKLILGSFIGPFLLTFIVVDFILLTVNMLKYFDEIFGKGLSFMVYMELISYFLISISPMALPLAVLLSSLMTFGNLGEHFELTAIKSSGISLLRALRPIGIFVIILSFLAYLSNNYLVPKVNLKTFSLLYDIRMKSPALDIKEGVFYSGIPNYSIKVNQKMDDIRLRDLIIYDHSEGQGNTSIILADSGRMEPFFNESYMSMTLYNGISYKESRDKRSSYNKPTDFTRTKFSENQIIFNLESFKLNRTSEDQWSNNRSIKNIDQLKVGLDSMSGEINRIIHANYASSEPSFPFYTRDRKLSPPKSVAERKMYDDSLRVIKEQKSEKLDSLKKLQSEFYGDLQHNNTYENLSLDVKIDSANLIPIQDQQTFNSSDTTKLENSYSRTRNGTSPTNNISQTSSQRKKLAEITANNEKLNTLKSDSLERKKQIQKAPEKPRQFTDAQRARLDSIILQGSYRPRAATTALMNARTLKNSFNRKVFEINDIEREHRRYQIAWYQKYTTAFACILMFMIGAPLGAIIKKGGLGMPVLVSIIFFIIYYMLTITGEKWGKEGMADPLLGTWFSILVLIPSGLFFLRQARRDARLFEPDVYVEMFKSLKKWWKTKFGKNQDPLLNSE
ncbi:LptF/LptG family permease [Belliella kenyensis]|uniref:LptF/LptG family permease n=1 Tax=Belliella kenyensis TaxID=1472724 RepID=A0ABV8EPB9_9BACT|nr:LptF/LptG family permease [Belliella kenyensis]MCH7400440.1 LptF/LptG family permease [Belliella kenyensis]MDN3604544.1 LptF/LptG family permease [Belliella kenyensis]